MGLPNRKKGWRAFALVVRDILFVGVVLVVFALFHHVIPHKGESLGNVVNFPTPGVTPSLTDAAVQQADPVQEPTPKPTTVGDFSAAFPSYDTGKDALYSYQDDEMRIAINQVQENDITYFIADVWVKNIQTFRTAFANGQYGTGIHQEPWKIAVANDAILAVTGDYYGARSKGVVIRNGDLYRDSTNGDVCVLYADGVMETYLENDFSVMDAIDNKAWQAWSFGPQLLDNGQAIAEFSDAISGKNPRSAIGYYEPGHYCFIVVDGRQPGYSQGMTLAELSQVFAELGCKSAYNLDGGATAQMIYLGNVINKPYNGGRQSSDIICF